MTTNAPTAVEVELLVETYAAAEYFRGAAREATRHGSPAARAAAHSDLLHRRVDADAALEKLMSAINRLRS